MSTSATGVSRFRGRGPRRPGEAHPVDEVLAPAQMFVYGLQHVLTMYAGVIAVPLIIGGVLKLPFPDVTYLLNATLLLCGLATLVQTVGVWRIGVRLPIVQGVSFASVATMISIGTQHGGRAGLLTIYGAVIVAGVFGFLIAPVFSALLRFFPPVVTGSVITIIGASLLPVAVNWSAGGVGSKSFGAPKNIGLAAATLVLILVIYRFLPGFFNRVAILAGLVIMTLVAIPLGFTDFSGVSQAKAFAISTPFHFGAPTFEFGAVLSMVIVMLVIMTETTADILAIGEIVDRPQSPRGVADGLRADCLSTAAGGVLNTFPCTAFAQNVGLVAVTGIRSRFVVTVSGLILIVLGLSPVVGAVVAAVPLPVLGGAGLVLFGTVASSGIRTLSRVDFEGNANLVIVAVAIAFGLIPIGVPTFYDQFPQSARTVLDSGISAASVAAVLLNILFNVVGGRRRGEEAPIFAEAPSPGMVDEATAVSDESAVRDIDVTDGRPALRQDSER